MHKETLEKVNFGQDGNETQRTFSTLRLLRTWPWPFCINPHHLVTKERLEHVHSSLAPTLDVSDQSLKTAFPGVLWATGSSTTCQLDTKCQTESGRWLLWESIRAFLLTSPLLWMQHFEGARNINILAWAVQLTTLRFITALSDVKCALLSWIEELDDRIMTAMQKIEIYYIYINLNLQYISTWCFACPEAWSMLQRCHLWCDPGADAEFCRLHPKILWPTGPFIDLTSCFLKCLDVYLMVFDGFW